MSMFLNANVNVKTQFQNLLHVYNLAFSALIIIICKMRILSPILISPNHLGMSVIIFPFILKTRKIV